MVKHRRQLRDVRRISPSHPELLDSSCRSIPAERLVGQDRTVREIVLSRAYRQASTFDADAHQQDPENRLAVADVHKRRLEAEAIRDAMLAVSGELDLTRPDGSLVGRVIGDKPISLIGLDKRLPKDLDGSRHRSVYLPVIRDRLPDVLDLFDFAEPSLVTGNRETTNVPTQALYLMNSPFVQDRAAAFAERLLREASDPEQQVRRAYALCFGRPPLADEEERLQAFLHDEEPSGTSRTSSDSQLVALCQALLCTAEFRCLD